MPNRHRALLVCSGHANVGSRRIGLEDTMHDPLGVRVFRGVTMNPNHTCQWLLRGNT
ncbi:MAG: hypothetical protein R3B83_03835 [Nitrospirales bacterium]|nr:hypothetical protein [Nitrospirales bacterium]